MVRFGIDAAERAINSFNARSDISLRASNFEPGLKVLYPTHTLDSGRLNRASELVGVYLSSGGFQMDRVVQFGPTKIYPPIFCKHEESLVPLDGAHRVYCSSQYTEPIKGIWVMDVVDSYPPFPFGLHKHSDVQVSDEIIQWQDRFDELDLRNFVFVGRALRALQVT